MAAALKTIKSGEEFVDNILKTLLNTGNGCLRENIQKILQKAGENHSIRYIVGISRMYIKICIVNCLCNNRSR